MAKHSGSPRSQGEWNGPQGAPEGSLGGIQEAGEARERDGGVERERRPQPWQLQMALDVCQEQPQLHPVRILQAHHRRTMGMERGSGKEGRPGVLRWQGEGSGGGCG